MIKKIIIFLLSSTFAFSVFSFANQSSHPDLTRAALDVYKNNSDVALDDNQYDWIVKGSIEEDTSPRYYNHFYNPITGKGLDNYDLVKGIKVHVTGNSTIDWLHKQNTTTGDYSAEAILNNYKIGNKERAFLGVGHVLHLLQDMVVPAHTRNDPHADGDSFEAWSSQYGKVDLNNTAFQNVNNLDDVFKQIASFSYNNFFSKDSVLINNIKKYEIENKIVDNKERQYIINLVDSKKYKIAYTKTPNSINKNFQVNDDFDLSQDYWNMLYPKAVGYSAGTVDYFLREFKKIDEAKAAEKLSLWQKAKQKVSNKVSSLKYYLSDTALAVGASTAYEFGGTAVNTGKENVVQTVSTTANQAVNVINTSLDKAAQKISSAKAAVLGEKVVATTSNTTPQQISNQKSAVPVSARSSGSSVLGERLPGLSSETVNSSFLTADLKYVIDGDTIVLTNGDKIRYIGVDTPEIGIYGKPDACLAQTAKQKNQELLQTGKLKIIFEANKDKDKYGRYLAYVYAGDKFINEEIVRLGLGKTFFCQSGWTNCPVASDEARKQKIINAESFAKNNKLGLYSDVCQTGSPQTTKYQFSAVPNSVNSDSSLAVAPLETTSSLSSTTSEVAPDAFNDLESEIKLEDFSLSIDASSSSSPEESSPAYSDTTAPTSTLQDLNIEYEKADFAFFWSGQDNFSSSSDLLFDIDYSLNSSDFTNLITATSATSTMLNISTSEGDAINLRVRAIDEAGNTGEWSKKSTRIKVKIAGHVVISEFVTRGDAVGNEVGANDEFVELYNPTDRDIDLSGYKLQTKPATGTTWTNRTGTKGLTAGVIKAHGYFILAGYSYSFLETPDYRHTANWGLADTGGHLRIVDSANVEIDKVGYGADAINAEGSPVIADLTSGYSLERKATPTSTTESMRFGAQAGMGNGYDSDDNSFDFVLRTIPDPGNFAQVFEAKSPITTGAISFKSNDGESWKNNISWDHEVSGSDAVLVVAAYASRDDAISSVTYAGEDMVLGIKRNDNSAYNNKAVYLYYLPNPANGVNQIKINAISNKALAGVAITLNNCDTSNPLSYITSTKTNFLNFDLAAGAMLIDAISYVSVNIPSADSEQTEIYKALRYATTNYMYMGASYKYAYSTEDLKMIWTIISNSPNSHAGIAIRGK